MTLEGYWIALDASCPSTQVALFKEGNLLDSSEIEAPAMQCMLESVKEICQRQPITLRQINGFIYCTGPGSILGIRLSIMAIKTWCSLNEIPPTKILTFSSLVLAASSILKESPPISKQDFIVCAEWKKDFWNVFQCSKGNLSSKVEVWDVSKIDDFKGEKRLLQQRKVWSERHESFIKTTYTLALLQTPSVRDQALHPLNNWEVYTPDEKQYATWSGKRHRSETLNSK